MESEVDRGVSAEAEAEREVAKGEEKKQVDIRRYYCEFCGISRSKRSLIASHMQTAHQVLNSIVDTCLH